MVSTRRTRSRSGDVASDALDSKAVITTSPRKTRSARSRAGHVDPPSQAKVATLPDTDRGGRSSGAPKKRGRPPKRTQKKDEVIAIEDDIGDKGVATPVRVPLADLTQSETKAGSDPRPSDYEPPRKVSKILHTPVKSAHKSNSVTPRLLVYESPRGCPAELGREVQTGDSMEVSETIGPDPIAPVSSEVVPGDIVVADGLDLSEISKQADEQPESVTVDTEPQCDRPTPVSDLCDLQDQPSRDATLRSPERPKTPNAVLTRTPLRDSKSHEDSSENEPELPTINGSPVLPLALRSASPVMTPHVVPQQSPVKVRLSQPRTPISVPLCLTDSARVPLLPRASVSPSQCGTPGEPPLRAASSPNKSLRASPEIRTPSHPDTSTLLRITTPASIEALLPHPSLSYCSPQNAQIPLFQQTPLTPETPTTTWIDGVEVPLPPDDWTPEKLQTPTTDSNGFTDRLTIEDHDDRPSTPMASLPNVQIDFQKHQSSDMEDLAEETTQHVPNLTGNSQGINTTIVADDRSVMDAEVVVNQVGDTTCPVLDEVSELAKKPRNCVLETEASTKYPGPGSPETAVADDCCSDMYAQDTGNTQSLTSLQIRLADHTLPASPVASSLNDDEVDQPERQAHSICSGDAVAESSVCAESAAELEEPGVASNNHIPILDDDSLVEAIELNMDHVAHSIAAELDLRSNGEIEELCGQDILDQVSSDESILEAENLVESSTTLHPTLGGDVSVQIGSVQCSPQSALLGSPSRVTSPIRSQDTPPRSVPHTDLPDDYEQLSPSVIHHVDEMEKLESQTSEPATEDQQLSGSEIPAKDAELDLRCMADQSTSDASQAYEAVRESMTSIILPSSGTSRQETLASSQDESLPSLSQILGTSPNEHTEREAVLPSSAPTDSDLFLSPIKSETLHHQTISDPTGLDDSTEKNIAMSPVNLDRPQTLTASRETSPSKEASIVDLSSINPDKVAGPGSILPLVSTLSTSPCVRLEISSEEPASKKQKKSSSRRQSRRQSYMTATKSAVRERELELRQQEQDEADTLLSTELDAADSLLQEMPGSVERKRTKRRSNSVTRKSPLNHLSNGIRQTRSRTSIEAETLSPVVLNTLSLSAPGLDASAIKIQALFRGWRERKLLAHTEPTDGQQESDTKSESSDPIQLDDTTVICAPEAANVQKPSSKEHDINDMFTDFLTKWQSKKSQKVKVEEPQSITSPIKDNTPATPHRVPAGTLSPQKNATKMLLVPVSSSAQKAARQPVSGGRVVRSRLPAPRAALATGSLSVTLANEFKSVGEKLPESKRGIPVPSKSSSSAQSASPSKTPVAPLKSVGEKRRKDAEIISNAAQRKRAKVAVQPATVQMLPVPVPIRSKTPPVTSISRPVTPTTPKRLLYLTPAEVTKTTRSFTSQNRLYRCDFDRVVVKKEIPRPPSPTAKIQAKMASNARTKRRRLIKEKGYTFGAGDDDDYVPKYVTPERKAVKWGEALEIDLQTLPKTSPSKVKGAEEVLPCIAPTQLDDYGNCEDSTPLTPEIGKAPKVMITKYLYRGEQDD